MDEHTQRQETAMTEHRFHTTSPVDLYVEIGRSHVRVVTTGTAGTHVLIEGRDADQVRVEQAGDGASVVAPKDAGLLGTTSSLDRPANADGNPRPGEISDVPQNSNTPLGSFLRFCASFGLTPGIGPRPM